MKKLMATCAALALAATSTLPLTAFAAEDDLVFSASVDKTTYNVGDTVTLTVKVDKNTGSNSWLALVGYDEGLTPKKVTAQEMVDGNASDKHSNAVKTLNPIKLSWTNGSTTYGDVFDEIPAGHTDEDAYNWTFTGPVSVITFEVTSAGSHTITLALDEESKPFRTTGTMGTPGSNVYLNYSVATPTVTFTAEGGTQDEVTLTADASLEVETGKTKQLGYTVNPTDTAVSFVSTDPTIATVSTSGVVTGVKAGTTTITTTAGDKTATTTVTVKDPEVTQPVAVTSVEFTKDSITLNPNEEYTAEYTINPTNATNTNVTFTSSNPTVANVDASGKITGIMPGTATITVTTEDGGKTDTLAVTVNPLELGYNFQLNTSNNSATIKIADILKAYNIPETAIPTILEHLTFENANNTVVKDELDPNAGTLTLTALAEGQDTITVTYNPDTQGAAPTVVAKINVRVWADTFTVSFKENPVTMKVGESKDLKLVVSPDTYEFADDYNDITTWNLTCSDPSILKIEEVDNEGDVKPTGKVTGLKSGTVVVTATNPDYCDDNGNMIEVTCTVTVKSVLPAGNQHADNPGETPRPTSTESMGRAKVSPYVAALPATTSTSSTAGPIAATGGEMMVSDNDETGNAPAIAAAALGVIALGFVVVARKKRHN